MPDYSLNWTARSSAIQRWQKCQWYSSPNLEAFWPQVCLSWTMPRPTRMLDSPNKKPARVKANRKLMLLASSPGQDQSFVSASHQTGLDTMLVTRRSNYSEDQRNVRSDTSWGSNPVWLCWPSAFLVPCGPYEPCWTWTQTWVQARIPDYSLNWIARSSAIQRCLWCSSPSRSRGPIFVSVSYQTGLETTSMTRMSNFREN